VRGRNAPTASWYTVLDGVAAPPGWPQADAARVQVGADAAEAPDAAAPFELRMLDLPRLGVGKRLDPGAADESGAGAVLASELGHAMHRALELLPAGQGEVAVLAALHAFALDDAQRRMALARARSVLALPVLAPAFDAACPAVCEFEILDIGGDARRIDRLARVGGETWVIDYKWSVGDDRIADYRAQLAGYRALVEQLVPGPFGTTGAVRTVLVDATAGQVHFDVDLG
jgi:ATP-dependent exoDNAse (exonuclease V) beta subunit